MVFFTRINNFNLYCLGISLHNYTYTWCIFKLCPRFVVVSPSKIPWHVLNWNIQCWKQLYAIFASWRTIEWNIDLLLFSLHNYTYTWCIFKLCPRFVVVSPSMLWLQITWELECLKIKFYHRVHYNRPYSIW
jgi:hypothetical protein